jgi:cellulose synthase/poly-beta-1,6-N-acetylglucosamine synthase-like glycosyltransferase
VKLVRVENGGKARALNTGMESAQYDIIVVLDADAVLDKDALWHFTKHFSDESVCARSQERSALPGAQPCSTSFRLLSTRSGKI